ncbi:MAG: protoporphyrinogen oxidase HemJ [Rhodospirillales bacterium]|jgi:putative membrane protein|nr:protoporphyrinogen oxidase HemJ [Rhodospirillales bacterium]
MADFYLWLKAVHIISIIAWMAGLLYLPRLFVYHTTVPMRSEASETFKVMELKLLRYIMNPAMIASFITGIWLIWLLGSGVFSEGWLHGKLTLVVAMAAMHGLMARWRREFAEDRNRRSSRFYRWMNEGPTLLMIGIVILVTVKPF